MEFISLLKLVEEDPIFESALLLAGNVNPKLIRIQLSRWVKAKKIFQLRRGLYSIAPPYQKKQPHPFLIANHLQKASYVSVQSALAFYGFIPEIVNVTTSVSTGRPERLVTPLGIYDFRHIKTEYLFGYQLIDLVDQKALVASPEKALLDLIYLQPAGDSIPYLKELRLRNTDKIDIDLLKKYSEKFKSLKIQNAVSELSRAISGESEEFEDL
jgi:predicted transcriptional regulator of viral defense system